MTDLIPRSVLFGNPIKANPQVSPDGSMLAYLAPVDGVLNILVGRLGDDAYTPITNDTNRGIQSFRWMTDSRNIHYIQDVDGDENYHLYSVNIETRDTRDLTPFENVRARVVACNKYFPDNILVAINREDPQVHDVYDLHIPSGELNLVDRNPGNVLGWIADIDLVVRLAMGANAGGGLDVLYRESREDEWRVLFSWEQEDSHTSIPLTFSKDGRSLLMIDSRNANAGRLVRLDLASNTISVIAEDPQYDVTDLALHPDTMEVQMVGFARDRMTWLVLDEGVREDVEIIKTLHRGDFNVISNDEEDRIWIVRFIADDGPVAFYAYDRSTRTATFLFDSRPELHGYTLASMHPINFPARDGLTIHGYITLPPGVDPSTCPMVLKVHGGPWVRDMWGYDSEAQWLANRGYACLQVNYRGSTGYGKQFVNAGDKEWGGRMHDDLVDAVEWAGSNGYCDPKRVAIYGGSYGGYAALVGATFTPELFTCAVDIVGPSNLLTFIETIPPYWKPNIHLFHRRVGNPETEMEFLQSRSPLFKVDRIKIPLLIAQGANDPRVKQSESEQIVSAMRSKGIAHEYMLFEDEGHGFAKPENRMKFYAAAERFLARYLGGRFEPGDEEESVMHELPRAGNGVANGSGSEQVPSGRADESEQAALASHNEHRAHV